MLSEACLNYLEELCQKIMVSIFLLIAYTHLEPQMNSNHMKMYVWIMIIITEKMPEKKNLEV